MDNTVTANIARKMGSTGATQQLEPGILTDALNSAIKSLQTYTKLAGQDPSQTTDVGLVRQIIQKISNLVIKDQQEESQGLQGTPEGQGMPQSPDQGVLGGSVIDQGSVMGGMGGQGGISMPDLTPFTQIKV